MRAAAAYVEATTVPARLTSCTEAAEPSSWPDSGPTMKAPWLLLGGEVRCLKPPTLAAAYTESWAGMTVPAGGGHGSGAAGGRLENGRAQRMAAHLISACHRSHHTLPPGARAWGKGEAHGAAQAPAGDVGGKGVGVADLHVALGPRLQRPQRQLEAAGLRVCG